MLAARPQRNRVGREFTRHINRRRRSGKSTPKPTFFVRTSGAWPGATTSSDKSNLQLAKAVASSAEVEQKFQRLAKEWKKETRHISSIRERSMNRAYQKIIALGKSALPFILRDLQRTRDHWLWALNMIEDENPAAHTEIFDEAVEAWLDWGRQRGYLS